jgi:RNA polymerase sigma-70 factor (ECF subfamily)
MDGHVERLAGRLVTVDDRREQDVTREFETRLTESSALAIRVAYSVVRNRSDAEDVAQEAFVRAHRAFGRLRDRDRFRACLVRMTFRLALDWKRGHRRRDAREDSAARLRPAFGNAEHDLIDSDRAARLWAAIDELPAKLRLVVVLAAIDGHGMRDVAALLGIPEGTVKSRLFEAKKQLQERLR